MLPVPTPPWPRFRIQKHPPVHAHLSPLYCLAAAARWFHGDDHRTQPTIPAIFKAMLAAVPAKLASMGITEKHLRMAGDACDLHLYRPNVRGIMDLDWPADWLWLAAVRGLAVPRLREPPPEREYVLVLGLPDEHAGILIADPHPGTQHMYRVPIESFEAAWKAGANGKLKPWAVAVSSRK